MEQPLPYGAVFKKSQYRKANKSLPEACIIRGTIKSSNVSTISWAIELPSKKHWNGNSLTVGGGGFDGFIPTDDPWYHKYVMGPSSSAYVRISSNSGHDTQDFAWGSDSEALKNHAYEANHKVLHVGIKVAAAFYGEEPLYRYMVGQSNGGRSGLMAAGKYPDDYDGVLAFAPALSQQSHQVNLGPNNRWLYSEKAPKESNWISPVKGALFASAEIKACDMLDGLKDGVISNFEACNYIPTDLQCKNDSKGVKDPTCFTSGQIEAIRLNYSDKAVPLELANGMTGYERYGRGGAATPDWTVYAFGTKFTNNLNDRGFSYSAPAMVIPVLTSDPDATPLNHDPLKFKEKWQALSQIMEPSTDLKEFAARGKLLVWFGVSDTCVTVYRTANFLEQVKQKVGEPQFQSFAQFVTSPAVGHDFEGPGAATADLLKALAQWVEKDKKPTDLTAQKLNAKGRVAFERPLCEWPKYPHYNGQGDPKQASSFTCKAPA